MIVLIAFADLIIFLQFLLARPLPIKRHDLCDLVHRTVAQLKSFEVNLVEWSIPQRQYRVIVTNNENYNFSVPAWRVFAEH
jgi:hypothetical protein